MRCINNTLSWEYYSGYVLLRFVYTHGENHIDQNSGYYDTSTALYKYGARYYNPSTATWTQLDPSGKSAAYIYAGDDPVNYTDVSGYVPCAGGINPDFVGCPAPLPTGSSTAGTPSFEVIGAITGGVIGCATGGAGLSVAGPYGIVFGCALGAAAGISKGDTIGGYIDMGVDSLTAY